MCDRKMGKEPSASHHGLKRVRFLVFHVTCEVNGAYLQHSLQSAFMFFHTVNITNRGTISTLLSFCKNKTQQHLPHDFRDLTDELLKEVFHLLSNSADRPPKMGKKTHISNLRSSQSPEIILNGLVRINECSKGKNNFMN